MKFEVKYHVNPETRVVIAMLILDDGANRTYCPNETPALYDYLKTSGLTQNSGKYCFVNLNYSGIYLPKKYIGISRCAEGDTFDEEFGKRLAKSRAYAKYYAKREKVLRNTIKELDKFHESMVSGITSIIDRESTLRNSFAGKFNDENGGDYMPVDKEV